MASSTISNSSYCKTRENPLMSNFSGSGDKLNSKWRKTKKLSRENKKYFGANENFWSPNKNLKNSTVGKIPDTNTIKPHEYNVYGNMMSISNWKSKKRNDSFISSTYCPKFTNPKGKVIRTQVELLDSNEKINYRSAILGWRRNNSGDKSSKINSYINRRSTINGSKFEMRDKKSEENKKEKTTEKVPTTFGMNFLSYSHLLS